MQLEYFDQTKIKKILSRTLYFLHDANINFPNAFFHTYNKEKRTIKPATAAA